MADFETENPYKLETGLCRLFRMLLHLRIQMDTDADDHGEKRITLSGMDAHIMEMVVIEHPVVHSFARSTVVINLLILIGSAWNRRVKPDIPVRFGVDAAAIRRGRTFVLAGTDSDFAAGKGTSPFAGMLLFTISPVDHAQAGHTQGSAVTINGDGVRNGVRPSPVTVEVNKRPDLPFLAEPIGGIVVMGGVQADIPDRDIRINGLKFPEGDNGADAVVPPGVQKTDMQWQVNADPGIVGTEHVKRMPEIESSLVAVPSSVCIRIGEMAFASAMGDVVFHTFADLMAIRGCMGMDTGAIAGKGDAICRDESVFKGRKDRGEAEDLLEPLLKIKGEFFMGEGIGGQCFRNAGMLIGKLLPFARSFRRLCVRILWEKVLPAVFLGSLGLRPQPVYEVKIRPKGRQGIRRTADENGQEAVGSELFDPGSKACKTCHHHKDKGTKDLSLVFGRTSQVGKEPGKEFHNGIQIQQPEFFPYGAEFKLKPYAL